ncbi:hypothetical protein A9Q87_02960 [Flavobacteriales bacterium 34_180_T64]|nr:hypothetical protein A9Q87_02960 [Flavobacteriales bacterium 34_180_T64]
MKKLIIVLCVILSFTSLNAQDTYTVNGETLELKTEVNGKLDLLWNIIEGKYRYFVRTSDATITELVNTKNAQNKYQEEYKTTLENLTKNSNLSTKKLNLTLYSLKGFIDDYNGSVDVNYQSSVTKSVVKLRLAGFGGVTNNPFVKNPDNKKVAQFGIELEVQESNINSRHAIFLQLKHVTESDFGKYSTTEVGLGYRFRIVNTKAFSLYANMKFATVNFSKSTINYFNESDVLITEDLSEAAFDVPFIFGVGADIRITKNSFITLGFNELFALLIDNQGNFPTDFTIGYKFNL